MFNEIGEKLKLSASVLMWVGIAGSIVYGLFLMIISVKLLIGLIFIVIGCLGSWLSCALVYALGELVDNSTIIANQTFNISDSKIAKKNIRVSDSKIEKQQIENVFKTVSSSNTKRCPHCGETVQSNMCTLCGKKNNLFD